MLSTISPEEAIKAAKKILGLYSNIPASDPKAFATALVEMLSTFPAPVIDQAINPANGIAAKVTFLNLAAIREHLDRWRIEHLVLQERLERMNRRALPPAEPEEPAAKKRVSEGFKKLSDHLASGLNPLPPARNDEPHGKTVP
jgi:hypothetical protein